MKIGIIIQARMGSTRYPKKVLQKIHKEQTILDIILLNLKTINYPLIVATTTQNEDDMIIDLAKKHEVDYYRGDEKNVLKRFIGAAEKYEISEIIRICADNVFIQNEFISHLINKSHLKYDYMSFEINGTNAILTHWGLFGEYVTLNALKRVQKLTDKQEYLEHVTNYIYTNSPDFKIKLWSVPKILMRKDVRLTIDTIEDFELCKIIIDYLDTHNLDWNYTNIINYLQKNPNLFQKMQENIKKNRKL